MGEKDNPTKKRIIAVAFSLFRGSGYDCVTINDICRESGISKHTFYYYFKSKDDVLASFKAVPKELCMEKLHCLINAENNFEAYWQLLSTILEFFVEIGPEITKRIVIMNIKSALTTFEKPKHGGLSDIETDIIKKAQFANEIRNGSEPRDLVSAGFSLMTSAILFWSISGGRHDLMKMARSSVEAAFDVSPDIRRGESLPL